MKNKITIEQNEIPSFKDVFINGVLIGSVMADNSMTPIECYNALKNNWEIDRAEMASDVAIDNSLNY